MHVGLCQKQVASAVVGAIVDHEEPVDALTAVEVEEPGQPQEFVAESREQPDLALGRRDRAAVEPLEVQGRPRHPPVEPRRFGPDCPRSVEATGVDFEPDDPLRHVAMLRIVVSKRPNRPGGRRLVVHREARIGQRQPQREGERIDRKCAFQERARLPGLGVPQVQLRVAQPRQPGLREVLGRAGQYSSSGHNSSGALLHPGTQQGCIEETRQGLRERGRHPPRRNEVVLLGGCSRDRSAHRPAPRVDCPRALEPVQRGAEVGLQQGQTAQMVERLNRGRMTLGDVAIEMLGLHRTAKFLQQAAEGELGADAAVVELERLLPAGPRAVEVTFVLGDARTALAPAGLGRLGDGQLLEQGTRGREAVLGRKNSRKLVERLDRRSGVGQGAMVPDDGVRVGLALRGKPRRLQQHHSRGAESGEARRDQLLGLDETMQQAQDARMALPGARIVGCRGGRRAPVPLGLAIASLRLKQARELQGSAAPVGLAP